MSLVVRKVENKRKFDKLEPEISFIAVGEIQADAVTDLKTIDNSLSIYIVPNESAIKRVIAAIASTRDNFDKVDYVTLTHDEFVNIQDEFNIQLNDIEGSTPDILVNSWHRDLIELTDRRIVELARAFIYVGKKDRMPLKKVKELVLNGIDNKTLNKNQINAKLLERLEEN